MIIVGIEGCSSCMKLSSQNPDIEYVILRRVGNVEIKKALHRLNIISFPAILSNNLQIAYSPDILKEKDEEIWRLE